MLATFMSWSTLTFTSVSMPLSYLSLKNFLLHLQKSFLLLNLLQNSLIIFSEWTLHIRWRIWPFFVICRSIVLLLLNNNGFFTSLIGFVFYSGCLWSNVFFKLLLPFLLLLMLIFLPSFFPFHRSDIKIIIQWLS